MSRVVRDFRLMADGQRVAAVVEDGMVVSVHLERRRLSAEAVEELAARVRDAEFDSLGDEEP